MEKKLDWECEVLNSSLLLTGKLWVRSQSSHAQNAGVERGDGSIATVLFLFNNLLRWEKYTQIQKTDFNLSAASNLLGDFEHLPSPVSLSVIKRKWNRWCLRTPALKFYNKEKYLGCICCLLFACRTWCFSPSSLRKIYVFVKHFPSVLAHTLIHRRANLNSLGGKLFKKAENCGQTIVVRLWNPAYTLLLSGFILVTSVGHEAKTAILKSCLYLLFIIILLRSKSDFLKP